jgi:hypothetical protein
VVSGQLSVAKTIQTKSTFKKTEFKYLITAHNHSLENRRA